jgi:hypothetical protein
LSVPTVVTPETSPVMTGVIELGTSAFVPTV